MENTLTELNNPLRMNRDARASSAGLSSNDKPFSVETIKERYWKREKEREDLIVGGESNSGTMEMILTRPPLWRSLLPPLFSWLNVILWIALEEDEKKKGESGRHQTMRTFRNSDEDFKPSHSNSKKHSQQYIVYVFMKKWGIIKIRKRIPMLFCLRPFIVILLKLSVATRLEYRAKGVQQLSSFEAEKPCGGRPTRTLSDRELWTLEKQPETIHFVFSKGDDCFCCIL